MSFGEIFRYCRTFTQRQWIYIAMGWLCCISSMVYPSNMEQDYSKSRLGKYDPMVQTVENSTRFINPALQIALPLLTRDVTGLKQLVIVAVTATFATHGLKWGLEHVEIMGTKIGQRPVDSGSKNMPSGHSSLAGSGAYFVARRYGWRYLAITLPVMFLTMYARVMLDAHTISAVIAGALLGILITAMFTTRKAPITARTSNTPTP